MEWEKWIGSRDAFPVKGYSINSTLFSVRDCQAIIKKAVVERLKSKYNIQWFDEPGPVHQIQFSFNKDIVAVPTFSLVESSTIKMHRLFNSDINRVIC